MCEIPKTNFKETFTNLLDLVMEGEITLILAVTDNEGVILNKDVPFYIGEDFVEVVGDKEVKATKIIPFNQIIMISTLDYEYGKKEVEDSRKAKEEFFKSIREAIENDYEGGDMYV